MTATVIPAEAGIAGDEVAPVQAPQWDPAFAGMTCDEQGLAALGGVRALARAGCRTAMSARSTRPTPRSRSATPATPIRGGWKG